MALHEHTRHPWRDQRRVDGPATTADQMPRENRIQRVNAMVAMWITRAVGTMYCFYLFNLIAASSSRAAFASGSLTVIVNWISSNWLQLTLLPALMVGQNIQGKAADARAEHTFNDVESILHALDQIAEHLSKQDALIQSLTDREAP